MGKHRSMAYFPAFTGRDEMSKQARFVVRMALACHEAGTPYSVEWKYRWVVPEPDKAVYVRPSERPAPEHMPGCSVRLWYARLTAEGNIPMPKPFPKAPKATLPTWKPNMFAEASYRLNVRTTGDSKDKAIAGWIIEHSSGLCLVKYGESETGELVAAEGEDVRDGWYVTHTNTLLGVGLKLRFQTACKALVHLAALWDGWATFTGGRLPDEGVRACLTVRADYGRDLNDQAKLKAMGGPIERPAIEEPAKPVTRTRTTSKPVDKLAANEARIAAIKAQLAKPADDLQARMARMLAELRANRPTAPAGKLAVTYPDGRVAYIPDPAAERRVSA